MNFGRIAFLGLLLLTLLLLFAVFQGAIVTKGDGEARAALLSVVTAAEYFDSEFEFCQGPIKVLENGRKIRFQQGKIGKEISLRPRKDGLFELFVDGRAKDGVLLREGLFEYFANKKDKCHTLRFTFWGTDTNCQTSLPFVVVKSVPMVSQEAKNG